MDREHIRVWLRAFWGFEPGGGGYLGFTNEGNRARFIKEFRRGDLVLIYGADGAETNTGDRRQALGFLEVDPVPIQDTDKSSTAEQAWKKERGWEKRWRFAVPVRRAWKVNRRVEIHHLARGTFKTHNAQLIASRCELMLAGEASAALRLPVSQVSVYGEPPIDTEGAEATMLSVFVPSRGVTPTTGQRSFDVEDGERRIYVLKLEGDVASFLGRKKHEVIGKVIVKVGYAKDPEMRRKAHNDHLPAAAAYKWTAMCESRPFLGADDAIEVEDGLKQHFTKEFESLGGEFFLVDETSLLVEFAAVTSRTAFKIVGV